MNNLLDTLISAEAYLAKLLDEGPAGELQRRLLVDGDEQTFLFMARLLNQLRAQIAELDDRE